MAKIFKFTGYFVDPAGECNKRDVKTALEEVTTKALDIFFTPCRGERSRTWGVER